MRRRITISANVPAGVSDEHLAAYVSEAIETWGGQYRPPGAHGEDDPGDPLFGGIEVNSIIMRGTKYPKP